MKRASWESQLKPRLKRGRALERAPEPWQAMVRESLSVAMELAGTGRSVCTLAGSAAVGHDRERHE
jgi:hypothetical protein